MRNAGRRPLDRVWLRLWGNGPVGCSPRAVTVTAVEGGTKRRLTRGCSALEILLPAPLARGATTALTLTLQITAPDIQDRFGSAEGIVLSRLRLGVGGTYEMVGSTREICRTRLPFPVTIDLPALSADRRPGLRRGR